MNIHNVEFIKSAAVSGDLINDGLPQIVFSGKSNVGKSSVINKLLNRSGYARVSSTPGKTVCINYFLVDKAAYFVDLPGYGYAKVSMAERTRWAKLMDTFFSDSGQIALGILIVDSRHKPTGDDVTMSELFKSSGCRFAVVANKFDKVRSSDRETNMTVIRDRLSLGDDMQVIGFSAKSGANRDLLLREIENSVKSWYNEN